MVLPLSFAVAFDFRLQILSESAQIGFKSQFLRRFRFGVFLLDLLHFKRQRIPDFSVEVDAYRMGSKEFDFTDDGSQAALFGDV